MVLKIRTVLVATTLVLLQQQLVQGATQQGRGGQQGQPGQAQRQGGAQRGRGGPPPELERRVREVIQRRMRDVLELPDTTLSRLVTTTFKYRDSSFIHVERERFLLRELEFERNARNRAPNDGRIACLMDNYWIARETRLKMRIAEDREVATFLPGVKRLQYFGMLENLQNTIDEIREDFNQRNRGDGRGGQPQNRGAATPVGRDGRPLGPPPGARGGPPGRGGFLDMCGPRRVT